MAASSAAFLKQLGGGFQLLTLGERQSCSGRSASTPEAVFCVHQRVESCSQLRKRKHCQSSELSSCRVVVGSSLNFCGLSKDSSSIRRQSTGVLQTRNPKKSLIQAVSNGGPAANESAGPSKKEKEERSIVLYGKIEKVFEETARRSQGTDGSSGDWEEVEVSHTSWIILCAQDT